MGCANLVGRWIRATFIDRYIPVIASCCDAVYTGLMGYQVMNGDEIMTVKIDKDGKPYDPAEKARKGLTYVRNFLSGEVEIDDHLNAVGDRLATCEALEFKVERQAVAIGQAVDALKNYTVIPLDGISALIAKLEAMSPKSKS